MTDQSPRTNMPAASKQSTGKATASTTQPQSTATDQFVAADQAMETGSSVPNHQVAMTTTPPRITHQPTLTGTLSTVAQQPTVAGMLTTTYETAPTSNLPATINQTIATSSPSSDNHPTTTRNVPAATHRNMTTNPSTPASQLTVTTTPSLQASQTPRIGATSATVQQPAVAGPSTAMAQTPVDPNTIPSAVPPPYTELRAHTAKCEKCNSKNRGVGWQCTKCIVKFCQACVEQLGEDRLRLFHPPCFKVEETGKPKRRRKRVRDSTDDSSKDVGSSATKPAQGQGSNEGKPSKAPKRQKSEEQRDTSEVMSAAPTTEALSNGVNSQQQNQTSMCLMQPECTPVPDGKPPKKVRKQRAKPIVPAGRPNTRSQAARVANACLSGVVNDIIEKKILENKLSPQTKEEDMQDVEQCGIDAKLCGSEVNYIAPSCHMVTDDTVGSKVSPESAVRPKAEEASSTPTSAPTKPTQPTVGTLEDLSEPPLPDGISSVVVNSGVVGLCIAYKLAQRNYETNNEQPVVVLDHLPTPEGSEMGAGRIVPSNRWTEERFSRRLAKRSFSEWKDLLGNKQVADYVHYRPKPSEDIPNWLRGQDDESIKAEIMHGGFHTINPARMMTWLRRACHEFGVRFVKCQRLIQITDDFHGKVTGVKYQTPNNTTTRHIACSNVILALGDSTEEVLQDIYGNNGQLRFSFQHEAQDWATLRDPWPEPEPCVFCADKLVGFPMDIVNRGDGTFWMGAKIVKRSQPKSSGPNHKILGRMQEATKKVVKGPSEDGIFEAKITKSGRNYYSRTQSGVPIISKVPISYLDPYRVYSQEDLSHPGGLFLCAGYGEEGLAMGMGIGQFVMSMMKREALQKEVEAFSVAHYLESDPNAS